MPDLLQGKSAHVHSRTTFSNDHPPSNIRILTETLSKGHAGINYEIRSSLWTFQLSLPQIKSSRRDANWVKEFLSLELGKRGRLSLHATQVASIQLNKETCSKVSDLKREEDWKYSCSVLCVSSKCNDKGKIKCTPSTPKLCSTCKLKLPLYL